MHPSRPIFTLFGNSFVPENHRTDANSEHPFGPLFVVLIAALVGLFITVAMVTASQRVRTVDTKHRQQPSYFLKAPPAVGFEMAVF